MPISAHSGDETGTTEPAEDPLTFVDVQGTPEYTSAVMPPDPMVMPEEAVEYTSAVMPEVDPLIENAGEPADSAPEEAVEYTSAVMPEVDPLIEIAEPEGCMPAETWGQSDEFANPNEEQNL